MLPRELTVESFSAYPPEARKLTTAHLAVLQQLPLGFIPLLLRETISYDWKFPAERLELDNQFTYLQGLSREQLANAMTGFASLQLSPALEHLEWVNKPQEFSEQLTAHLWTTHQIDAFRKFSIAYVHDMTAAQPAPAAPAPRLAIAVIGNGVSESKISLFRKLRPYGTYFKSVDPKDGRASLLEHINRRATQWPEPFAHWYVNGTPELLAPQPNLTSVSYSAMEPVRLALIGKMRQVMQPGGGGPEKLRTMLAQMRPEDLGLSGTGQAGVLSHFQISVLTEGSGTQLFSTTFVQWSAREALRRAQPLTLLAHFGPRVHEASMNELLAGKLRDPVPDPQGALVDADMGAFYTWINLQRLPGADQARFLAWFENHAEALAIGPSFPRGRESQEPLTMRQLLGRLG